MYIFSTNRRSTASTQPSAVHLQGFPSGCTYVRTYISDHLLCQVLRLLYSLTAPTCGTICRNTNECRSLSAGSPSRDYNVEEITSTLLEGKFKTARMYFEVCIGRNCARKFTFLVYTYVVSLPRLPSPRLKQTQVEIGRTRNRRQQSVVSEPRAVSDARCLPDAVTLRQQQQSMFFFVAEEDGGPFSLSRTWRQGEKGAGRGGHAEGDKSSPRSSGASSTTSTLPPSPDAAGTAAAARQRSELPPLVPKTTRSRCTTGTCRRQQQQQQQQQSSRTTAYFA